MERQQTQDKENGLRKQNERKSWVKEELEAPVPMYRRGFEKTKHLTKFILGHQQSQTHDASFPKSKFL